MKRLVLIDGNSLIHRAYHALPPLTAPDGTQVNAVYGFTMMLLRVLEDLKPEYIAMTFDLPGPTFRHIQYVGYKANRPKADDGLVPQFQLVRDVTRAFNIPIFEVSGYEADDLVGTLAHQAKNEEIAGEKLETIIVSGDTDTLQLVDEQTKVFTPRKGISDTVLYDVDQVKQRYGFGPDQLTDYKGLKGDTSDNIPGVPGIGDKTAVQLIQTYGSLEGVYANLAFISGKLKDNLAEYAEQAKLSKVLGTIVLDAPITLKIEETKLHDFNRNEVVEMFQRLGFRTLMTRLNSAFGTIQTQVQAEDSEPIGEVIKEDGVKTNYKLVEELSDIKVLADQLKKQKEFAFDTETDSQNAIMAQLVGISFSYRMGEAFYVPYTKQALAILKPLLEDSKIKKIGHNLKYDAEVLQNEGVEVKGMSFDTMIAAWLSNQGIHQVGLKSIAFQELGVQMTEITELIGKGKNQITMAEVEMAKVAQYACADADITYRLKSRLEKKLRAANAQPVFENFEMPLIPVITKIERNGVLVDCDFLKGMSNQLAKEIAEITTEIYASVGHEFNLNSPKQLADVLYLELKLPIQGKTKGGTGFSTDEASLSVIKDAHPMVPQLLKYREYTKLKNTYIDALPVMVNQKTNRVHGSFNQTGTASGRLSSSDPNLQNIPIRTPIGAKIRRAFIADKDSVIFSADYSQIELRILAHVSQDPVLLKAFHDNEDIHIVTAALIYNVNKEDVTKEYRRVGKTMNFALMYGMSAFGLAQSLSIERKEAAAFIERYFINYAGVKTYFEKLLADGRENGYVETISGRRRYIPELTSPNPMMRKAGERMAINLPMQGTNADIIKLAMISINHDLERNSFKTKMILQVHDELVFEVPNDELTLLPKRLIQFMVNAKKLSVPIIVEGKVGQNWGEMKRLET